MYQNDQEDVFDALQERVDVAHERQDYHRDEEEYAEYLHGLLELFGDFRQIVGRQDAEGERNAQQDEDGLEHVPERDCELRDLSGDVRQVHVEVAVEPEVEGGREYREGGADGGKAHRQLDVRLRERADEVRDVAAGTGGHQYHSHGHGPGY